MDRHGRWWARAVWGAALAALLAVALAGCADFWRGVTGPADAAGDLAECSIWVAPDAFPASLLEAMPKGEGGQPPKVPAQVVVKLKSGRYSAARLNSLCTSQQLQLKGRVDRLRLALVQLPAGANEAAALARLASQPDVESVSPNYIFDLYGAKSNATPKAVTNDQFYLWQWGMDRIGFSDIAPAVLPTSAPIVALLDTGVDYNHPDLVGKIIKGADYFDGDLDPMDVTGHGTHCAGIIAGTNNNNLGVAGVSGTARILAVRIGALGIPMFAAAAGIVYAADSVGVKVMSMSWGGYYNSAYIADAIAYAVSKGILPVAAAGNGDTDLGGYPSSYAGVLSVAATTLNDLGEDQLALFSDYGPTVDIAAPGVGIYSTTPVAGSLLYGPMYDWSDGTSMATPFVAGAAAIVRGKWPTMSAQQTANLLTSTAECPVLADADGHELPPGVCRLDLYNALEARLGSMPSAPGALLGIVVDANSGLALGGATVTAKSGALTYAATTRPDGTFTMVNMTPGTYSVTAAKSTYATTAYALQGGLFDVFPGEQSLLCFIALPKAQAADVYTAVVSWVGWGIVELDSYLWLPGSLPLRNQYMVSFFDRGNLNANPFARFLRDEPGQMPFRWWGPVYAEALVFRTKYAGSYMFAVNDFWGGADWENTPAVVQLFKGGALVATYPIESATGSGVWWTVFTMNGLTGSASSVQELTYDFAGPYGEEFFTVAGASRSANPASPVPWGTFVRNERK